MGTSVGPFDALAGLFGGITEGVDKKRALARQAKLDAQTKEEKDRVYGLEQAAASLDRAKTISEEGLVPDTGGLTVEDVQTDRKIPLQTGMSGGANPQPFDHLIEALGRSDAASRISILDPTGATQQFRQGTPLRIQQERETQAGIDARSRDLEAMKAKAALELEGQRAGTATAKEDAGNQQDFGTFQAAYPQNQFAKQYNPNMKYKPLMDRLDKMSESAAARADRESAVRIAHEDRVAALGDRQQARAEKGTGATKLLPAPLAARVGQFGEMLKKSSDIMPMVDDMDVTLGKSAARDLAEGGVHVPFFGTVPGTKGVGERLMANSPAYAQYQAALQPFILAAAHAMSGARINADQTEKIRKSIELAPGDFHNKNVRDQKQKNLIDLINSIGGSLPPGGVDDQEAQMDEAQLTALAARGYKRRGGGSATANTGGDKISAADFAKLSPSAQQYFRSVGRAP